MFMLSLSSARDRAAQDSRALEVCRNYSGYMLQSRSSLRLKASLRARPHTLTLHQSIWPLAVFA